MLGTVYVVYCPQHAVIAGTECNLLHATALYLQEVQAAYDMGLTGLGKFLSKSCFIYKTDITTYKPYIII